MSDVVARPPVKGLSSRRLICRRRSLACLLWPCLSRPLFQRLPRLFGVGIVWLKNLRAQLEGFRESNLSFGEVFRSQLD